MITQNKQILDGTDLEDSTVSRLVNGLSLMAVDQKNLRGFIIKGRSSPIRQQIFQSIAKLFNKQKFQKIHPRVLDSELFSGIYPWKNDFIFFKKRCFFCILMYFKGILG